MICCNPQGADRGGTGAYRQSSRPLKPASLQEALRTASALNWVSLLQILGELRGAALTEALAKVKPIVGRWPASLRRISNWNPETDWILRLFAGDVDPRLELVGQADLFHHAEFKTPDLCGSRDFVKEVYPIVKVFARALDPAFDPPDTVLGTAHDYTSAAGVGGGFDEEKRGDSATGMIWHDRLVEHAADESADGDWRPYGLRAGFELAIGRYLRTDGYYKFAIKGAAPRVFELACAWGVLLRERPATPRKSKIRDRGLHRALDLMPALDIVGYRS